MKVINRIIEFFNGHKDVDGENFYYKLVCGGVNAEVVQYAYYYDKKIFFTTTGKIYNFSSVFHLLELDGLVKQTEDKNKWFLANTKGLKQMPHLLGLKPQGI